ncbi:CotY/CotZ family spore coat protein, partial [Bacillus thuringiensis]|nr:CotY/CotZ family spore coat protein [Bacillus thuringiensis]
FILYTKTGEPFEAFAPSSSLTSCRSPIFRVESVDDDSCAVLRVLTFTKVKGNGLRKWIGELLSCYWCTG